MHKLEEEEEIVILPGVGSPEEQLVKVTDKVVDGLYGGQVRVGDVALVSPELGLPCLQLNMGYT